MQFIKRIASWNGFPKQVVFSLIKRFGKPTNDPSDNNNLMENNVSKPTLWFKMPYIGQKGEQILCDLTLTKNSHMISHMKPEFHI